MDERKIFIDAENALTNVVNQIKDDQWGLEVPEEITPKGGSLRTIINYHAYDDSWVPDTLAGKTIDEVGSKYDGDLLGADPKASWSTIVEKSVAAVQTLEDLDKPVHLSYGDYPAREYLWHITIFRGFRAVDIARFIGVDDTLPDELVEGLKAIIGPHADEWRQIGVFGPAKEAPADANAQEKLLALTGRRPRK